MLKFIVEFPMKINQKSISYYTLGYFFIIKTASLTVKTSYTAFVIALWTLVSEKVAVKILDKTRLDAKTRRLLSREITSMEKMHHPNIVRLYEVVETLSKLYIVLEYAQEGELYTRIMSNPDGLPESDAKFAFAQIVSAVQHMVGKIQYFKVECIG